MWPVTYKTVCFGFVLLRYAIGLKELTPLCHPIIRTETEPMLLAPTSFPALCVGYMYWLKGLVAPSFVTCQSFGFSAHQVSQAFQTKIIQNTRQG